MLRLSKKSMPRIFPQQHLFNCLVDFSQTWAYYNSYFR